MEPWNARRRSLNRPSPSLCRNASLFALPLSLCRIYIYVLEILIKRRTIGLAVHDDGGPALRVGGALLHRSDRTFPDAVRLGGETGATRAERRGRGQQAGSNDGGGELHCCRFVVSVGLTVIKEYGDG